MGTAWNKVLVLYGKNRLALACHKFGHNFSSSSHVVGMEKYRCFLGTTHEKRCSLNTQNTEGQASVRGCTKSARQRF
jgi:hypothetical protein